MCWKSALMRHTSVTAIIKWIYAKVWRKQNLSCRSGINMFTRTLQTWFYRSRSNKQGVFAWAACWNSVDSYRFPPCLSLSHRLLFVPVVSVIFFVLFQSRDFPYKESSRTSWAAALPVARRRPRWWITCGPVVGTPRHRVWSGAASTAVTGQWPALGPH